MQRESHLPRPTRPRSWCRLARPKRSALFITISVALGTSMPTSITCVATRTSVRPAAKSSITLFLSSEGMRPCSISTLRPLKKTFNRSNSAFTDFMSAAWVSSITG